MRIFPEPEALSQKNRKTIFTNQKLYILCKFQLCSPYNGFWKLMLEEE